MSLVGLTSLYPYSLTGIQDITGTVNGSTPIVSITIAGQTFYLSASSPDVNGNVVLTLNIITASTGNTGLLSSTDWNTFNGKENVLTFTSPLTRGGNTISFDFSTANTFTGVNTFSNLVNFNHNIQLNALPLATTSNILYIDLTGLVSYGAVPPNLLPLDNIWTGSINTFDNSVIIKNIHAGTYSLIVYRNNPTFPDFLYLNNAGKMGYYDGTDKWTIDRFGQFVGGSIIVNDSIQATNSITTTSGLLGGLGLNIQGNQIFLQSPIATANNYSTLSFDTGTKQVGYSPSLLGTTNTFSASNFFTGDVIVGNNGRLTVNTGDGIASTVGSLTVCFEGYAPTWNVSAWTDRFALFSHGNGVGRVEATSSALGICQLSANENYIVSLRPSVAWMNTTIAGGDFSIKYTSNSINTCTFSNFITTWYESNGDPMSYLVRNGVTSLKWVVYRSPTSYAYYDTTANVLSTTSDARTKKNIRAIDIEKSKQFILSITPSIFQHKDGDVTDTNVIGFIAQDILLNSRTEAQKNIVANWRPYEEAMARQEEPKDILGVSSTLIIPELVGTIQLLNKDIEQLKQDNTLLKQENDTIKQDYNLLLERISVIEQKLVKNRTILKY
jgi:hypothetical protein